MKLVYALQPMERSIFLAGPTPRSDDVPSWRPEAIQILERMGFDGTVYIPETSDGEWKHNYDDQINWEWSGLNQSSVVVFWVPRELENMPAFTTNVEFGLLVASGKVVYGRPDNAPKNKYLDALAVRHGINVCTTLYQTLKLATHSFYK